jgi:hypothetical protein
MKVQSSYVLHTDFLLSPRRNVSLSQNTLCGMLRDGWMDTEMTCLFYGLSSGEEERRILIRK